MMRLNLPDFFTLIKLE